MRVRRESSQRLSLSKSFARSSQLFSSSTSACLKSGSLVARALSLHSCEYAFAAEMRLFQSMKAAPRTTAANSDCPVRTPTGPSPLESRRAGAGSSYRNSGTRPITEISVFPPALSGDSRLSANRWIDKKGLGWEQKRLLGTSARISNFGKRLHEDDLLLEAGIRD